VKIVIPGGSGQVGTLLARHFHHAGHEVTVLSRSPETQPWRVLPWDARTPGPWAAPIDGADVVINLAGRSVNCRYNQANKHAMMDSRVLSTRVVGQAIAQAKSPPRLWLQASTATIYAHRFDAPNDEQTGIINGSPSAHAEGVAESSRPGVASNPAWHFSVEIALAWERECDTANTPRTRKVLMRSAMTMSPDKGGIFDTLLTLVRRGLGGTAGGGRQYISWVHETDFIAAIEFLIAREDFGGPVNIASPNPLPNAEFMRELRRAARTTLGGIGPRLALPATAWMLEAGAVFMRTQTELILKSRRVVPGRLLASGFSFALPRWPDAALELCRRSAGQEKGAR
jgi:uncharacterized protein